MSLGSPELDELLKKANEAYNKLTPEQKLEHARQQYISWAYGQVRLSGTEVSKEEVERIIDEKIASGELDLIKIRNIVRIVEIGVTTIATDPSYKAE